MKKVLTSHRTKLRLTDIAFLILFATEFTYYLLILQTGVVSCHHSRLSEIMMLPVGGVIGIASSITIFQDRKRIFPALLSIQLLISLDYAHAGAVELFMLGLISGITAPMLIYRIDKLWIAVFALGISYISGTAAFQIQATDRMPVAVILSVIAFISTFFANIEQEKKHMDTVLNTYTIGSIFTWLLLDSILFETLLRDDMMHLWGEKSYLWTIVIFHTLGLLTAYLIRKWEYVDITLALFFIIAFWAYSEGDKTTLSIVYPFIISWYNVLILYKIRSMHYLPLSIVSVSLWTASGLGLLIALSQLLFIAWILLGILFVIALCQILQLDVSSYFKISKQIY